MPKTHVKSTPVRKPPVETEPDIWPGVRRPVKLTDCSAQWMLAYQITIAQLKAEEPARKYIVVAPTSNVAIEFVIEAHPGWEVTSISEGEYVNVLIPEKAA